MSNVIPLPRVVASTDAVAPLMLKTLRDVRDWMDSPEFRDCPLPVALASAVRITVAKAQLKR